MNTRYTHTGCWTILFSAIIGITAQAQIEQGGIPYSFSRASELPAPAIVELDEINMVALAAEDAVNDLNKSIPYRFGYNYPVALSIANSGTWTTLDDGTRVWRLRIECPGAISINFEFDQFNIPDGARVFVMDPSGKHIGAFNNTNDNGPHVLGVQPVRGPHITIEYSVPAGAPLGQLRVGQVTHGYRDVFKYARGLGDSGSCNNNVICPEGNPWADQIRSVAMIVVSGSGICTGTLINNCLSNGTPYFLTANHCLPGNLNVSTWVFRFNWNSPTCTPTTNGPTNQTVSGASLLANSAGSDVALLQLNSTPPAGYSVYYSGWDRSGTAPTNSTCIHHPSGDIKKISFDNNAATTATYGGAACWRIATWEDGTTEPGSSGSGLWDQNKRLIGQLYGGQATCANNINDYYGRLNVSFPSLQNWLGNCGNTVNGYDPNTPSLSLDAQVMAITGASGNTCATSITPSVSVRNGGTTTLTSFNIAWSITGGGSGNVPWSGSLASGSIVSVPIGSVSLPPGYLTFTATVNAPNGGVDQALGNNTGTSNITTGPNTLTLQLNLDRYGAETTWVIRNGANTLASGGPYTNQASNGVYPQPPIVVCVPDGCHELVVYDSFGDGMCCAYGAGNFTLRDAMNNVLATNTNFTGASSTHAFCVVAAIGIAPKIFLEGPYGTGPTMTDGLRSAGLIPSTEPYTALGYTHVAGGGGETINAGVLANTGNNAIVDWVFVQLRSTAGGYPVVATRSALVQRDGDVVGMDGSSPVTFSMPAGSYHVAIRHRNHLGIMTANALALTGATTAIDFTNAATVTYGTEARKNVGGVQVMWAGNVNGDTQLLYVGSGNDRDPILVRIGGSVPTLSAAGYFLEDVNMNGTVLYVGNGNDRDPILVNIGGSIPTNNRVQQLP